MTSAPDHPRSRGVYSSRALTGCHTRGSSPLARGLLKIAEHQRDVTGIIPARAGFTRRRLQCDVERWDHPRSRGVYSKTTSPVVLSAGSSPLARGLLFGARLDAVPHGSSPLARGLRGTVAAWPARSRIIPARAGFTLPRPVRSPMAKDHPRSRGVYLLCASARVALCGSSPLARGLPEAPEGQGGHRRIIPARAGFTPIRPPSPRTAKDHPRSRGVYLATAPP